MKIEDSFRVEVPVEEAWKVLLDLERIAPCLPGAQLTEVEGDEYRGTVKVKVGPITAQYKGVAKIEEADEANRKVVLQAEGRDTRGQGNASATVTATLVPDAGLSVASGPPPDSTSRLRLSANWPSSLLETSAITPRPNCATLPVTLRSVSTWTRVLDPSALSVATMSAAALP